MAFAENLNHLMEINEISNYFIAKELGSSQTSVANWRSGNNFPHKKTRIAIASLFGLSLEEIDGDKIVDAYLNKKDKLTPASESELISKCSFLNDENRAKALEYIDLLLNYQQKK